MRKYKSLRLVWLMILGIMISCSEDEGTETVVLKAPVLNPVSVIAETSFGIVWSSVAGAKSYEIDLATDKEFSQIVEPFNAWKENGTGITFTKLNSETTYFTRVRASDGTQFSPYSTVVSVKTTTPVVILPEPTTPLKEAATTFNVGNIVQANRMTGTYKNILTAEFDQITAEYEMKMNIMYPSSTGYNFTKADQIVDFAVANGLEVHGHSLIWHNATPSWVENFSGTNEEFETMIKDYIITTVSRYKGKVKSWDVVNEAFEDGGSNGLRNSVFRQKMGDDFIEKCFKWTREADPDVLIFYNDYNMVVTPGKLASVLNMVDDFQKRGVPIDGVGFQMHISYNGPAKSAIATAAKKITDRNIKLHFSELDIRANPSKDLTALTKERAEQQALKVKEVVEVYNAIPEASKFALTIWGVKDNDSWLMDFWGHIDWPLLWDKDFNIKKAHTGFLDGLK